jgi:hypothetical protein
VSTVRLLTATDSTLVTQSQVIEEVLVMVKVTLVPLPLAGTLPEPVQPVQTNCVGDWMMGVLVIEQVTRVPST